MGYNGFAIDTYLDAAAVTKELDELIKKPVYSIRKDKLTEYVENYFDIKSAGGYLRRELGRALNLRYTPELNWELDDSITYGAKMLALINSLDTGEDKEDVSDES